MNEETEVLLFLLQKRHTLIFFTKSGMFIAEKRNTIDIVMGNKMNYEEAVDFHEETKQYGSILGLSSIRALMHELKDVWKSLNIVHIAGTNGKGSVSSFLSSALTAASYCTGVYNSPAVFDLREVYQINGSWITKEEYAACMDEVSAACKRMTAQGMRHPTVFEVETALAFLWFYRRNCEIVILETGMGGGTDATNLIEQPLCSVFVPISLDHTNFLGDSLEEIAKVKSGIIKSGCPVITADQPDTVDRILRTRAVQQCAAYDRVPQMTESRIEGGRLCCRHQDLGTLRLSMTGSYQTENAAVAIQTLRLLQKKGYDLTDRQIREGIEHARMDGRFTCLSSNPLFYMDGAHNASAAEKLKESLIIGFPNVKKIGIMGVMSDKPFGQMLKLIKPVFDHIYTVTPDHPRALPAEYLAAEAGRIGIQASAEGQIENAVLAAYREAEDEGDTMAVAFGSLYYLKEVKHAVYQIKENKRKTVPVFINGRIRD